MHVLLREFSFVKATPHNRASFVNLFWRSFANIARKTGPTTFFVHLTNFDGRWFLFMMTNELFAVTSLAFAFV